MNYFSCADISIPLPLVTAISWTKTAKTVQRQGGAIVSRGFEPAEISVRVAINAAVCEVFALDYAEWIETLRGIDPWRMSPCGTARIGGFAIYPELDFAITNANKTIATDAAGGICAMELDLVFSGVALAKEVSRERALQMDRVVDVPNVTLSVGDRSLSVQDGLSIAEFSTAPDALHLVVECGSDMDLVSRDGFLEKLSANGIVTADLPTGSTKFYVAMAFLMNDQLIVEGSIYPQESQQTISETYVDQDVADILADLCRRAGLSCDVLAHGHVDYYRADGTPMDCIREIAESAGIVISYRQGRATFAFLPRDIMAAYQLDYLEMRDDSESEPISGCFWYDTVNLHITGDVDKRTLRVLSRFRAADDFSAQCLAVARFRRHRIVVSGDIDPRIDSYSVVSVVSNDSVIDCLVTWFSCDWINNIMEVELNYI